MVLHGCVQVVGEELVGRGQAVVRLVQKVHHASVIAVMCRHRVEDDLRLVLRICRGQLLRELHVRVQLSKHLLVMVQLRRIQARATDIVVILLRMKKRGCEHLILKKNRFRRALTGDTMFLSSLSLPISTD